MTLAEHLLADADWIERVYLDKRRADRLREAAAALSQKKT